LVSYTIAYPPVATGTGLDETASTDALIDSGIKEITAARVALTHTNGVPAESGIGVLSMERGGIPERIEIMSEINPAKVGAIDQQSGLEPRFWRLNSPVASNATIKVFWEGLDGLAANGQFQLELLVSTERTGPHIKSICSRETADSVGTHADTIKLNDPKFLVGYGGAHWPTTVAADDPAHARLTLKSNAFKNPTSYDMMFNPIAAIEATSGVAKTDLTFVDLTKIGQSAYQPFNRDAGDANMNASITVDTALGTAGGYAFFARYI